MDILSKHFGFKSFLIMAGNDFRLDMYQSMVRYHVIELGTQVVAISPVSFSEANDLVKFTAKSSTTISEFKMFFFHAIR